MISKLDTPQAQQDRLLGYQDNLTEKQDKILVKKNKKIDFITKIPFLT